MNTGTKNFMVGSVAVCAAVVALYFAFVDRSPKLNLDPYDVLGAVTAEETAKLLGNKGLVLLIVRDTGPNKNPSVEAELKAFQETLKKQRGLERPRKWSWRNSSKPGAEGSLPGDGESAGPGSQALP